MPLWHFSILLWLTLIQCRDGPPNYVYTVYRVPARREFKCSRHHKLSSSPLVVNDWRLHTRGWGTTCRLAAFPPTLLFFFSEYFLPSYHQFIYSQQTNMGVIIAQSLSLCLGLTSPTYPMMTTTELATDDPIRMLWICPLTRNLGHSLYSQFRMSDMKTARPRIPSPRTGAIVRAGGGAAVGLGQPLSGFDSVYCRNNFPDSDLSIAAATARPASDVGL